MSEVENLPVVDHIAFQVSDLELSLKFYCDSLNFKLLSKTIDTEHHEAFAFLELEGGNLEILQLLDKNNRPVKQPKPKLAEPFCPHLAIKTNNLEQTVLILREKNILPVEGPLEIPGVVKWLYIADPDNNILEYVQWIEKE